MTTMRCLLVAVAMLAAMGAQAAGPGSLDPTFLPEERPGTVLALAEQPDGRILIGGYFGLLRLHPDGRTETEFHPQIRGWPGAQPPIVNTIALQPDGKILVGGQFAATDSYDATNLVRLLPDGSPDVSFSLHGSPNWPVESIIVQPNGRILLAGRFDRYGSWPAPSFTRLLPGGELDPAFNPGSGPDQFVNHMLLQPDGRIVIAGNFNVYNGIAKPGFARVLPDGRLDPSFNSEVSNTYWISGLAWQGSNILVAGTFNVGSVFGHHLVRLFPNGALDTNFHNPMPNTGTPIVATQPDGKIVIGGFFTNILGAARPHVARLNANGSLDLGFNAGSGLAGQIDDEWDAPNVYSLLILRDSRILVGGNYSSFDGQPRSGIARLLGDFDPARSFVIRRIGAGARPTVTLIADPPASAAAYAIEELVPQQLIVDQVSHDGIFNPATGKLKFGPYFDATPRALTYRVTVKTNAAPGVVTFQGIASADGANSPVLGDERFVIAGLFPADLDGDYRISIGELTAYGAAWHRGQPWPLPPSPIPMDYVTRAAMLWRAGECYTVNPGATNPPLWWVPCSNAPAPFKADSDNSITRESQGAYVPGEPFSVILNLTPATNTLACAVEELLPAGWTISTVSPGGEWDTSNSTLRWGPYLEAAPRTLHYTAVPPLTASGPAAFAGSASFDGASLPARGGCNVKEACLLRLGAVAGAGRRLLTVIGGINRQLTVEVSDDLLAWRSLATVNNSTGQVQVEDPSATTARARFYRVVPVAEQ